MKQQPQQTSSDSYEQSPNVKTTPFNNRVVPRDRPEGAPNPACVSRCNAMERDILWSLSSGPRNGQEIKDALNKDVAKTITSSRVYRNIHTLKDKGFLVDERTGGCKQYSLTDRGREALERRQRWIIAMRNGDPFEDRA